MSPQRDLARNATRTTILVVHDEVLIRAMISEELRSHGHTVVEAANPDEALAILGSSIRVDIVLTDMHMPRANGGQLAKQIRSKWPF